MIFSNPVYAFSNLLSSCAAEVDALPPGEEHSATDWGKIAKKVSLWAVSVLVAIVLLCVLVPLIVPVALLIGVGFGAYRVCSGGYHWVVDLTRSDPEIPQPPTLKEVYDQTAPSSLCSRMVSWFRC